MSSGHSQVNPVGVCLLTFAQAEIAELVEAARLAESHGYGCVYTTESLTDTLAIDMAIAAGTSRINVGSFVALTYLRHPIIAAQAAATISDVSGGRFVLGLGLGHRPRNEALGVDVGPPARDLRDYVEAVRAVLDGNGRKRYPELPPQIYQGRMLDFRVPAAPVPVCTAAVGPKMAELGGQIADGLMLYMQPQHGLAEIQEAARHGASRAGRKPEEISLHLGIHAFVAEDEALALRQARQALAYWVGLPAYNSRIADTGFAEEAAVLREAFQRGDMVDVERQISDELVRQFCLVGPPAACAEQLRGFRAAGADVVAVIPDPVFPGEGYVEALNRSIEELAEFL